MNKRQKIVQQRFLDNEEAVIKALEKTYNRALKDIEKKAKTLQDQINSLQAIYDVADEADKAVIQSMQQSKVYQKQYQDALQQQISAILDNLQVEEFKTIDEYLQKCYEEGFIGTMFDLHGQGIPLIFPIDQTAVVRAVQVDSQISEGLYNHLGENVKDLKKNITAEISRGISNGSSFAQVAQQLSYKMIGTYENPGGALAYTMRIARTEGHRIQVQSAMDACYKAKEKGCNVVKQWDASLDKRTRDSHARVDGEIRELDETFSNGLMFPGDPDGGAAEVVNCRCALLQRAKWALDEEELDTLKDRAEYFGLDKTANFDEYKRKYLQAAESITKTESNSAFASFSLTGIDDDYIPDIKETFDGLMNDYPIADLNVKTNRASKEFGHFQGGIKGTKKNGEQYAIVENEICISKTSYKNRATSADEHLHNYKVRMSALENAERCDLATIPHEYGHAIDHDYVLAKEPQLKAFADKYKTAQKVTMKDVEAINDFNRAVARSDSRLSKEIFDELQKEYNLDYMGTVMRIDMEYGSYAASSISEFLAEAFANMRILDDKDKTDFMKSFEKIFNRKYNEVFNGKN